MVKFATLFSGSSGNCIFTGDENTRILIDAGCSAKKIKEGLHAIGEKIENISAILITHEHTDHISGLGVLLKQYRIPVYISRLTLQSLVHIQNLSECANVFLPEQSFNVGSAQINPFALSHDAAEPSGFHIVFNHEGSVAVATDTGVLTDGVLEGISGADLVCIESNYDENMLKMGNYPYFLKRRILSQRGHLSNDDCAELAVRAVKGGARQIVLSHLSRENNFPELALMTTQQRLEKEAGFAGQSIGLAVSPRFCCSEIFTV